MYYVYLLRSIDNPKQTYIGSTDDLKTRFKRHNEGGSIHTAKYAPWKMIAYTAFDTKAKAASFELYLKSGSGRAFAKRHLW